MKEVNDNNFAELVTENSRPSVVDFWAPWCGPCRAISPIIEELAAEYEGKVDIYKCNVDHHFCKEWRSSGQACWSRSKERACRKD